MNILNVIYTMYTEQDFKILTCFIHIPYINILCSVNVGKIVNRNDTDLYARIVSK